MNDWQKLRLRYGSNKQYKNRSIGISSSNWDDFLNFLVDSGADILTDLAQDEKLRFRLNGELGIVYEKGSGNLLAHDMAEKYIN